MSLLAWYPFNGNGEDHSVNRNTISFTSGAYSSSGRTGKCISAGSSKTVTVPGLSGTIDFTLAFWVYPKSSNITANWTKVISLSDGGNTVRMEVCSDDSRPRYGIYNNSGNVIFPTAFTTVYGDKETYYDSWHHIVVTRNASHGEFYLDGSLVSSVTPSATGTLTGELFMNPTVANLSDVRVYNKRISKKEVMDLYRSKIMDVNFENLLSIGHTNLYSGVNTRGKAKSSSFTISAEQNSDGIFYNYSKTLSTAPTSNSWYNVQFPTYTFTAGKNYLISVKVRVNTWTVSKSLTLRHARLSNDYGTEKHSTVASSSLADGRWRTYQLVYTIPESVTNRGDSSPLIEFYTDNMINVSGEMNFDLKDVMVVQSDTVMPYFRNEDKPTFVPDVSGEWNKLSYSSGFTTVHDTTLGTCAGVFNGSSAYLYRTSIFAGKGANSPFTVLFSFNSSSIGNTQGIICDRSTTGGPFTIFILGSKFRIDFNSQHTVNYTFSSNTWYHCAVTFSGSEAKAYINGTLVGTWSATLPNVGTTTAIGASHSNGGSYGNYFVGKIADIIVYGSCLSADEIKHFYHSRLKFTKTNGIDFYRIEEDNSNSSKKREIFSSNMVASISSITEDEAATKVQIFSTAAVTAVNIEGGSTELDSTTVNGKLGVESLTLGSAAEKDVDTTISSETSVNIPTSAAVKTYIDEYVKNNLK